MRKLVLLVVSLLLCACTLQQGTAKFDLDEEFVQTEYGTSITISSLELDYISRVTDCLSYELFNEYLKDNKEWKEAEKEQRLVTLNDMYTASVVRYSLDNEDKYYVFKIKELEDSNVMYEVDLSEHTNMLSDFFEEEDEIVAITFLDDKFEEVNGFYITSAIGGRNYDEKAHDLVVNIYKEYAEENAIEQMPFNFAIINTMFYSEPHSSVDPFYVQVNTGNIDPVYVIERNAGTYSDILYDQPIPENNKCVYVDSDHGNFLCLRYEDHLYYDTFHILDSFEIDDLLEETKTFGDQLFDEYTHRGSSPDLWKDTIKEYRLITVNGEYTASIARYSAMHPYGRAYKYFFLGLKEEDGKTVMYEVSNTNQDSVTDTVVSFFENEEEIVEFELDDEKYDVVNGFYIPKTMEGDSFLVAPYNQMVESYKHSAENNSMSTMPFKYVDIEPLYYYKDGTLTYIYIHTDYGTHTMTYHYKPGQTPFHSGTYDEILPEDGACQLGSGYNFTFTLCREGDTLYHTTTSHN